MEKHIKGQFERGIGDGYLVPEVALFLYDFGKGLKFPYTLTLV